MKKVPAGRAVFLDRDGVINKEVDHLHKVADLRILPGAARAIRAMNKKDYRVVVISNQGVIGLAMATHDDVHEIHQEMRRRLARQGAVIDAIYICPHHPKGTIKKYAIACDCRKPGIGMLVKAAKDLDLDLSKSFLVGDQTGDILAGKRAGVRTILVATGYGGSDGRYDAVPDFKAKNLLSATAHIS